MKIPFEGPAIFLLILFLLSTAAFAQTTAFNFQGRLNDGGNAANANYDFQFKLFDALAGGAQVGPTINQSNMQVINGIFSTTLNFGGGVFDSGNRFLEVSIRPAGSPNAYVVLGARQQLLSVPYAVKAVTATSAETAAVAGNSYLLDGISPDEFVRLNTASAGNINLLGNIQQSGNLSTGGTASITGNTTVGGNAAVTGTATISQNAAVTGNATVGGTSTLNGNVMQPAAANGTAKAMLYVFSNGVIDRCYNGVTGNSSGNCGFTLTQPLGPVGVYRINFGFQVDNRFVSATSRYGGSITSIQNTVPQFQFINSTTLEIFMTRIDSPADTTPFDFMLIVF
ncbi:MAG: hypothetical protein JSS81_03960 [Acidobacteria bacterium]|nr:hypothetical protein [Acidobacteriota bacterium]